MSTGPPSIHAWLDGQYEYMDPDHNGTSQRKSTRYIPPSPPMTSSTVHSGCQDSIADSRPSDRSPREYGSKQLPPKDRYRPVSPPPEERGERREERERERRSSRHTSKDRDHDTQEQDRPSRSRRDTRHPPKSEHGRRRRRESAASMDSAPHSRRPRTPDRDPIDRKYSMSSSPHRDRGDRSSRHNHRRREKKPQRAPSPPRSSRGREEDGPRHHGGGSNDTGARSGSTRPRRSSSTPAKDFKTRLAFLKDPRFTNAAKAALQAGATVAVGVASEEGRWSDGKGARVAGAALSAAAMDAIKRPTDVAAEKLGHKAEHKIHRRLR